MKAGHQQVINRYKYGRSARIAIAALSLAATAAAASNADLTVSINASPNPVGVGQPMSYNVVVRNVALFKKVCVFDLDLRPPHKVCETDVASDDASGVALTVLFPNAMGVGTPPSQCVFAQPDTLLCSNLFIAAGSSIVVPFTANAPSVAGVVTASAKVNGTHSVPERTFANNTASRAITVRGPVTPPALPDLFVSVSPAAGQANLTGPNAFFDLDFSISNIGTVAAQNPEVLIQSSLPAGFRNLMSPGGFSCTTPSGYSPRLGLDCYMSTLAPNQTVHIIFGVALQVAGNNAISAIANPNRSMQELTMTNNTAIANINAQ